MELARLSGAWAKLQGEPWGTASWPIRLHNGVLWIGVADASWAQRLAYDNRRITRRAAEFLGIEITLRHRVTEAPPPPPEPLPPVLPIRGAPGVNEALAAVPDGALKQVLQNYLERLAGYQSAAPENSLPGEEKT